MEIFLNYTTKKYENVANLADEFISLHPASHEITYAMYMKAISYYVKIKDPRRSSSNAINALSIFELLVNSTENNDPFKIDAEKNL